MLAAVLMSRPAGAISSVLFLCVGLTHAGWVLAAPAAMGWIFRNPALAPFSGQTDAVAMFAVTGIVFGILTAIATQRLSSLGWMATATTASLVVCTFSRDLAAVATAQINLAIAIPMYVEVRRGQTLALSRRLGYCAHCGYDLTGIAHRVPRMRQCNQTCQHHLVTIHAQPSFSSPYGRTRSYPGAP